MLTEVAEELQMGVRDVKEESGAEHSDLLTTYEIPRLSIAGERPSQRTHQNHA